MNKTRKVALHKRRVKIKKYKEKHKTQALKPSGTVATSIVRR